MLCFRFQGSALLVVVAIGLCQLAGTLVTTDDHSVAHEELAARGLLGLERLSVQTRSVIDARTNMRMGDKVSFCVPSFLTYY